MSEGEGDPAEFSANGPSLETEGKREDFFVVGGAWIDCSWGRIGSLNTGAKLKIERLTQKCWQR